MLGLEDAGHLLEFLKNEVLKFLRNSDPGVLNGKEDTIRLPIMGAHSNRPGGRIFERVRDEIAEDLRHLAFVVEQDWNARWFLENELDVLIGL